MKNDNPGGRNWTWDLWNRQAEALSTELMIQMGINADFYNHIDRQFTTARYLKPGLYSQFICRDQKCINMQRLKQPIGLAHWQLIYLDLIRWSLASKSSRANSKCRELIETHQITRLIIGMYCGNTIKHFAIISIRMVEYREKKYGFVKFMSQMKPRTCQWLSTCSKDQLFI